VPPASIAHWPVTRARCFVGLAVSRFEHTASSSFGFRTVIPNTGPKISEISEVSEVFPFLFKLPVLKGQVLELADINLI